MYGFKDELAATLAEIDEAGLTKHERELTTPQSAHVATTAGDALNFCANNYLGLADHPDIVAGQGTVGMEIASLAPDVVLTPLVAFDEQGQRLGMGGGFYDRTLQNWQQYGLQPVGYAHDCQGVEALPVEKWDVPLPAVVTPSKIWVW